MAVSFNHSEGITTSSQSLTKLKEQVPHIETESVCGCRLFVSQRNTASIKKKERPQESYYVVFNLFKENNVLFPDAAGRFNEKC